MAMTDDKNKATAAVATVAFHAVVALLLIWLGLTYSGTTRKHDWPPADTSELLMEGEYVKLGETPVPNVSPRKTHAADERKPAAPPEADDRTDAGEPAPSTLRCRHPRWSRP